MKTKEVTYVYDVYDRRIAKDVDDGGDSTIDWGERYVHDGTNIALVYDRSDTLVERLLYGPAIDQPLASEDGSGDVLWFLADNQGTIRDVAEYDDTSGDTTVVNHINYGGFGKITSQTDANHEPRHTYTGREWDADAELFYYRARWYDPLVGRFISEDPIGFTAADANLSRYVGNSPVNLIDPSGQSGMYPGPLMYGGPNEGGVAPPIASPPPRIPPPIPGWSDRERLRYFSPEASADFDELFDIIDTAESNTPRDLGGGPCNTWCHEFTMERYRRRTEWEHDFQFTTRYYSIDPPIRTWYGYPVAEYHVLVEVQYTDDSGETHTFYLDAGTHLNGDTTGNLGGVDNVFWVVPQNLTESETGTIPRD